MLKILLIVIPICSFGCATREYRQLTNQVGEYGIQSFYDAKSEVTCFVYRDDDASSMSCLRVLK